MKSLLVVIFLGSTLSTIFLGVGVDLVCLSGAALFGMHFAKL